MSLRPADEQHLIDEAKAFSDLDIGRLAMRTGDNRTSLYRKIAAAFWVLALIGQHDPTAALKFFANAIAAGLGQREQRPR